MFIETASGSLMGDRNENQDRLSVTRRGNTILAVVADGMGGHESGAEAAQAAIDSMHATFAAARLPLQEPRGFLAQLLRDAHSAVVKLGADRMPGARPRATCVVAIVQDGMASWAHIGDSRVYWLRGNRVLERTRDHSHVEILLQEGLITEEEFREHPLRNYVEYCLGGEPDEPTMTIADPRALEGGDILLLCSDGLWSGAPDDHITRTLERHRESGDLQGALTDLLGDAVMACTPEADNTTAAVVLWQDPPPG